MNLVPSGREAHSEREHEGFDKPTSAGASVDRHAGHRTNAFQKKFWISLILSVPVVLYSEIIGELFGWMPPEFPGSRALPPILASVIFFYGGWIFLASAWRELKARLPGMMTLISLAIITAYAYSVFVVIRGEGEALFWELSTLITIMLLGHWLEMRSVQSAQGALRELSKLLPDTAEVVRGSGTAVVPLSELRAGDVVFVKPGGKVPADGTVVDGSSEVDESIATGESRPVSKKIGDGVIAGTANGDGSLKVKVKKIGDETFLAGVMRLVRDAQSSKSRLQILSDRAALYLTVIAVVAGGITFSAWIAAQSGISFAVERLVAVLVIACPHALGLAIPLVASISTTKAARNGFLIRQRLSLEAARDVGAVLFDKTGTLTKGEYGVVEIRVSEGESEKEILRLGASINAHSEHPIAKAMLKRARETGVDLLEVKKFLRIPGKGVRGLIRGTEIRVGGEALIEEAKEGLSADLREFAQSEGRRGRTINYVIRGGKIVGALALADIIREESYAAVRELRAAGVRVAMITGDSEEVASWVAKELGIDEVFARVLPHEKVEKVKLLQSRGLRVAMVGDGINDAPALTQADVGIAIGAGTNVAIESAGIILVRNDPRDIPKIIRLSRMTYAKMIQNLFWATGYNVIAIPLAGGLFASRGVILEPAFAALLMSLSTVVVALNALLLRRKHL